MDGTEMEWNYPEENKQAAYIERRSLERFDLNLPAAISMTQWGGACEPVRLISRDVSAAGAYFPCDAPMQERTPVKVIMTIPNPGATGRKIDGTQVMISGSVIRTDSRGMAIRFNSGFRMAPM
jgi:hypothetical protein